MDKLKKLHKEVSKLEKYYEECAGKALEKNNMSAVMLHSAEAGAYTRVRWIIEDMMSSEDKDGKIN